MNFDLINAWRSSGLFRRFQNPGPGPVSSDPVLPSPGIGTKWPEGLAAAKKPPFGSPYQLSISPTGRHWGSRKAESGLTEEELKTLYARIASLKKPASARLSGEDAASQVAAAYAAHSTAVPRRHRYDDAAPAPAATPTATVPDSEEEASGETPTSVVDEGGAYSEAEESWTDAGGSGDVEVSEEPGITEETGTEEMVAAEEAAYTE